MCFSSCSPHFIYLACCFVVAMFSTTHRHVADDFSSETNARKIRIHFRCREQQHHFGDGLHTEHNCISDQRKSHIGRELTKTHFSLFTIFCQLKWKKFERSEMKEASTNFSFSLVLANWEKKKESFKFRFEFRWIFLS